MIQFLINEELCTQCGECAADCPAGAVSVLGKDPGASTRLSGTMMDPGQLEILIKGR